ncbi:DUF1778 domain-containing protein [Fluviibacter phosphoraccumulans]|uniref:type II toxin-antitoxin system TacA family antitoxin n=1 Tax=Fluviibacter phosphoraccumulans TaxID=1751046 RepID=UPI00138956C4|nr:DUF1778 domain-containing protein [Fluviibacter phosphoraccumulans]
MTATLLKDARIQIKTSTADKDLLIKAALLDGMDVSTFVLTSAIEKARDVLNSHTNISLSIEAQKRFVALFSTPLEPTDEMQALMTLSDFPSKK